MTIQYNTDKTINGDEKQTAYFTNFINHEMERFNGHITRIEVHMRDENGTKEGVGDIRCMLEARLEGRQPIAVTSNADTVEGAVSSSLQKLKKSVETILGKIKNH